jgi:hypothetical protein
MTARLEPADPGKLGCAWAETGLHGRGVALEVGCAANWKRARSLEFVNIILNSAGNVYQGRAITRARAQRGDHWFRMASATS